VAAAERTNGNPLVVWYPWVAALTALSVLAQAFMAGRFLYEGSDLVEEHGFLGNLTFILVILLVVGAWLGRQAGVMTTVDLGLSLLLLVLVAAQFGLGYSDSTSASALHIPNGVLVTGLTFAVISRAFTRRPVRA
jgi:hypothetical protein